MAQILIVESKTKEEDEAALCQISHEMEKGTASKIVWFSDLGKMIKESFEAVNDCKRFLKIFQDQINRLEKSIHNYAQHSIETNQEIDSFRIYSQKKNQEIVSILNELLKNESNENKK